MVSLPTLAAVLSSACLHTTALICRPGKYVWTQADPAQDMKLWQDEAKWQYWVDDGVDGKSDGELHSILPCTRPTPCFDTISLIFYS
jgi:hypothetical protein